MNLEQMKLRLAAIVAKLGEYKDLSKYSEEDVTQVNALSEEFESLKKQIETSEKIEAVATASAVSARKVQPLAGVEVGIERKTADPKQGFKSHGEFFRAVAQASNGKIDSRLNIQAGMTEKIGEDGGFLVPTDFRQEIQKKVTGDESLLPRTRQFQTSSNTLVLPTYESAPYDSTHIQAYWDGEAAAATESKAKFGEMSMRLHKLTAMVRVTEELLEDAPALESFIKMEAPEAIVSKINNAIIGGSGVGMPLGFLNSSFKYTVAKEGAQGAGTVWFENVNKMLGRIIPVSFGRSVWLVNPAIMTQLRAMKFDQAATSPVPVYMPPGGVSDAPFGTLYGRPVIPMLGGVKAAGTEGDISLVDLSYYYTAMKSAGVKSDVSTHVYFSTSETAFKFSLRMAGQCPFKAPITTENGAFDMSGFVTLAVRA